MLDCFHATRLAIDAVDQVRRRVQNQTLGHRGRRGDPLYGIRRLLRRGAERLTAQQYEQLLAGLGVGDPTGELGRAWIALQELRHVYDARDERHARSWLHDFYTAAADSGCPEIERLARTIEAWQPQLLAYFTTAAANGPTEAVNLLISGSAGRLRFPKLRQLPAPPPAPLRHVLAHFLDTAMRTRLPQLEA